VKKFQPKLFKTISVSSGMKKLFTGNPHQDITLKVCTATKKMLIGTASRAERDLVVKLLILSFYKKFNYLFAVN